MLSNAWIRERVIDDVPSLGDTCIVFVYPTQLASWSFRHLEEHCSARDFAIVGKLTQTVFPGGEGNPIRIPCFLVPDMEES
jgi:hypothetical protein